MNAVDARRVAAKTIAVIAILAQIGSHVPADRATLGLYDGIYTRCGAGDDIARGRSTFMAELAETSEILARATPRSLLIFDELGRGTSTYDGLCIAASVLEHVVKKVQSRCAIFITRALRSIVRVADGADYPQLAAATRLLEHASAFHMSFIEQLRMSASTVG